MHLRDEASSFWKRQGFTNPWCSFYSPAWAVVVAVTVEAGVEEGVEADVEADVEAGVEAGMEVGVEAGAIIPDGADGKTMIAMMRMMEGNGAKSTATNGGGSRNSDGDGHAASTTTGGVGSSPTIPPAGSGYHPGLSGVPSDSDSSTKPGNIGLGGLTGVPSDDNTGSSSNGLPPGTIAGIVVGLLVLLALLVLLLFKVRQSPLVQKMLAPFTKAGGAGSLGGTQEANAAGGGVSSAFTPSPVSPISPVSMLSPGVVHTGRPRHEPGDPRVISATDVRISSGSFSSISTGSAVSAALSPGQMPWPMPPSTPSISQPNTPVSAQGADREYINFEESGETVVRIAQPSRVQR
ncbi:hypothetical protein MFIFM68171_09996 [Madurella fahalii]|uniref:Uncharacterized protein n=1 Tax=Madurella fahalii TaxID=1157608 RepID=A0ABQ0GPX2_9PEZI